MNTEFFMSINIEVEEKDKEEFLVLVEYLLKKIRESEQNISAYLLEDRNVPNTYMIWEIWKSEQAFQEHINAPYFQEYIPKIGRLYSKFKTTEMNQIV